MTAEETCVTRVSVARRDLLNLIHFRRERDSCERRMRKKIVRRVRQHLCRLFFLKLSCWVRCLCRTRVLKRRRRSGIYTEVLILVSHLRRSRALVSSASSSVRGFSSFAQCTTQSYLRGRPEQPRERELQHALSMNDLLPSTPQDEYLSVQSSSGEVHEAPSRQATKPRSTLLSC